MPISGNTNNSNQSGNTPVRIASNGANINIASGLVATTVLQGYTLVVGDLVLLKDQTLPVENGVYVVPTTGSASRDSSLDISSDAVGRSFFIRSGANAGVTFNQINSPGIVGTDALAFVSQSQGILSNFLFGGLSTNQTSNLTGFTDRIKYDTIMNRFGSDITLDTSTPYTTTLNVNSIGRITLKAGGTYKMMASAIILTTGGLFAASGWQNADTGVEIGTDATQVDSTFTGTQLTSQPISCAFFSPTVDTRVQLMFKNNVGAVQKSTAGTNNATWFSVEKIAGNAPVTGQSVDYINIVATTPQTTGIAVGSPVLFNTPQIQGNIPHSAGVFTLQAGKTYRLEGQLGQASPNSGQSALAQWKNITSGAFIGNALYLDVVALTTSTGTVTAQAVITPTVTTTVRLEFTNSNGNTTIGTNDGNGNRSSWANITQLGSSAVIATTPIITTSAPAYTVGSEDTLILALNNTQVVTLPLASASSGRLLKVTNPTNAITGTNPQISQKTFASAVLDKFGNSVTQIAPFADFTIQSDGTNWRQISGLLTEKYHGYGTVTGNIPLTNQIVVTLTVTGQNGSNQIASNNFTAPRTGRYSIQFSHAGTNAVNQAQPYIISKIVNITTSTTYGGTLTTSQNGYTGYIGSMCEKTIYMKQGEIANMQVYNAAMSGGYPIGGNADIFTINEL